MSIASSRMSGDTGTALGGKDASDARSSSISSRRLENLKALISSSFLGVFSALSKKVG